MAMGGSTKAVLHPPAIAHEAGVRLTLADFDRISHRDLTVVPGRAPRPGDLHQVGASPWTWPPSSTQACSTGTA
jgi:dihydroxy-acid dehydratase